MKADEHERSIDETTGADGLGNVHGKQLKAKLSG